MPWVYNEDGALKLKLQGLTVSDANNSSRPVPVRFRLPEDELATLTYPIIIIEHVGVNPDPSREHRGIIPLGYAPEGVAPWWPAGATSYDVTTSPIFLDFPLPYNLDYSVTIYCRKMAEHLQPLIATLASLNYLPSHFGELDIPQDGTFRELFLMQGPQIEYGKDKDDKRLFRATYMVRVETEVLPPFTDNRGGGFVQEMFLNLGCYSDVTNVITEELAVNQAIISTGPATAFNVGLSAQQNLGAPQREALQTARRKPHRAIVK